MGNGFWIRHSALCCHLVLIKMRWGRRHRVSCLGDSFFLHRSENPLPADLNVRSPLQIPTISPPIILFFIRMVRINQYDHRSLLRKVQYSTIQRATLTHQHFSDGSENFVCAWLCLEAFKGFVRTRCVLLYEQDFLPCVYGLPVWEKWRCLWALRWHQGVKLLSRHAEMNRQNRQMLREQVRC